jgi:peptide/nickel transport system ATP-binding protein
MRQRELIALAFSMNPRLLVADEPTTALDVTVQADILGLLRRKAQESGAAVLFISHDLALVSQLCQRLYVLRRGRVIESGPTEAVLASRTSAYTRTLVRAALQRERREVRTPVFDAPAAFDGRHLHDEEAVALALHDVGKVFVTARSWLGRPRSTIEAVRHVTLAVRRGEVVGIIGESGSGKTTLARLAQGLIAPTTGTITRRATTQMVFQDPKSTMNPRLPAWRIVTEPAAIERRQASSSLRRLAEDLLEQVGVGAERAGHYLHQFSGGQRQRLAVARALSCRPDLLILDEPTSALDVAVQAQVLDLLQTVQREYGLTYLLISHDVSVVRRLSTQVAVMRQGEIVEWGDARRLLERPDHPYTKALLSAVPALPGAIES